jgi:hypothetical protein
MFWFIASSQSFTWGFWAAVAVLAIVPCGMAAYGGQVAANSILDKKARRTAKLIFWGSALLGIVIAGSYQYQVSQSDDTTRVWRQSVSEQLDAIVENPAYSPSQRQVAAALKKEVARGHAPNRAQPTVLMTPAYGNLAIRCDALETK